MLHEFCRLTSPHSEGERVHEGLRPPFTSSGAFVVHPKLGKMQRPKVSGGGHFEGVCTHCGFHQPPVDVVQLGVLFVSMLLEAGVENGHRGGGPGERGERWREEGFPFEGLQKGLKVGASAVGGVPSVGGYHL